MRGKQVNVRFSDDEHEQLTSYARSRGVKVTAVVYALTIEALAKFDRHHGEVLDRLDRVLELLGKNNVLAAGAVVSAALPVGVDALGDPTLRTQMKDHIRKAIDLGANVSETYDKGTFQNEPANAVRRSGAGKEGASADSH
jgi:hypothetical protein